MDLMESSGKDILEKALGYLERQARPLEARRWDFRTGQGDSDAVMDELQTFAYPDGGYGRGLESDMRADVSSVLGTVEALDIMLEIGLATDHPARRRALEWLLDESCGYDADLDLWPYLKGFPEDSPRAPWWDLENLSETFGGFLVNPRGRVVSHLYRAGLAAPASGRSLEEHSEDMLRLVADMESAPPDTFRSLMGLSESLAESRDAVFRERLDAAIIRLLPRSVETDPAKWGEYGLQPLEVAGSPGSPWYGYLEKEVSIHLEYLAGTQLPDGSWAPFWTWGKRYPEAWKEAEREWKGVLTLKNLTRLKAFGRIG